VLGWQKLLVATGGLPIVPAIEGIGLSDTELEILGVRMAGS
jgi:hypothetical protein